MGRTGMLLLVMLAACAHKRQLNYLEQERVRFRAQNEGIRVEELERRYEEHKAKADRLSSDLLTLTQKRDRLYGDYDGLRAELAQLDKDQKQAAGQKATLQKTLAQTKAALLALRKQVELEQKAVATLQEDLKQARQRRQALEAKKSATKTPE